MKGVHSSSTIDPLLLAFVQASEEDAQLRLEELIGQLTPVLRENTARSSHPDDDFQEAARQLVAAANQCRANPETKTIADIRNYTSVLAANVRKKRSRDRAPEFSKLKKSLDYVLNTDPRFSLWQRGGQSICGMTEWQESLQRTTNSERSARLLNQPLDCEEDLLPGRNARQIKSSELLGAIFEWLGHPIRFDDLAVIVVELKRIVSVVEVSDQSDDDTPTLSEMLPDPQPLPDEEAIFRELLKHLWSEIELLPPLQRIACLLNFTIADGQLELFRMHGIAGIRRIGKTLQLSEEHLARLWAELQLSAPERAAASYDETFALLWPHLPLNDLTIARMLDTQRQKVINLRMTAIKRIQRRMSARTE